MIGAWKLGPALAMGNSVVLKPSETASLSLMRMYDLALEAGLPPVMLNAVTGEGNVDGEVLVMSMDVDVFFCRLGPDWSAADGMRRTIQHETV